MQDIGGVWRTIGGRRVFIKDGQELSDAMKESGKFKNMFGHDRSTDYLKNRELIEVDNLSEMKGEVDKFILHSVKKYNMKENDIKGEINLEQEDSYGKKFTSFSVHYGKEINEFIDIYKDKVKYVTLSENSGYYGMKEKKTIDLRKRK